MQMRARWSKSELNKRCCSMLSFVFIQFRCTLSINKFWKIISVDRDPSQWQQTIGEFVSITHMGKQRSPILIVHRSPVNTLGDRQDAITGYLPYCIVGTFGLVCMWWDHVPRGFILQSDWLLKILRGNGRQKMHGNATRPLSQFFGRGNIPLWLMHKCAQKHYFISSWTTLLTFGAFQLVPWGHHPEY